MAINKKLIHFKNKLNFDTEVANGNILDESVVFIQDSKEFSTHLNMYPTIQWGYIKSIFKNISEAVAGDVCLANVTTFDKVICPLQNLHKVSSKYIPIGIVVVPGNHLVYGENTCGVMSLAQMNCDNPTMGSIDNQEMYVGTLVDIPLTNYNVVIIKDNDVLSTKGFGYLSKNNLYAYTSLHIPDPYNEDLSRNPDYYNTAVSAYNAMSDFKGRTNTNSITGVRGIKNYDTWKPTYNIAADWPAASCCDMYYTVGTKLGSWYLPAAGEFGYILSKWNIILNSITVINNLYGNIVAPMYNNASYWTSSEHNSKNMRYVHTDNGMGHTTKNSENKVRAFTIIKEKLKFPIYLYTKSIDTDFFRRNSDSLALDIIDWYNLNCITESNGNSYIAPEMLSGKLFVDDYEVTSMSYTKNTEYITFETDNDYSFGSTIKVLLYKSTQSVSKGTIDIM